MKRIFIFGAGAAGRYYAAQVNKEEYTILGFIDNDHEKKHRDLDGLLIYGPEILLEVDFDEIHIASSWVRPIKRQLMEVLNIPEHKIKADIPKRLLKAPHYPFTSEEMQLFAKRFINEVCLYSKEITIPIYLDSGCLLGIMRGKELIRWDDDIDFVVLEENAAAFLTALNGYITTSVVNEFYDYVLSKDMVAINIDLCPKKTAPNWAKSLHVAFNIGYRKEDRITIINNLSFIPLSFLSPLQWIELYPGQASTFNSPEEYLTLLFGNWREENRDWNFSCYGNFCQE